MTTQTVSVKSSPAATDAALLDVRQAATLLGVSPRTIYRLADGGRMPSPIKLGALVRWRAEELRQWIADGCPKVRATKGGAR